jgi:hypothetical protein
MMIGESCLYSQRWLCLKARFRLALACIDSFTVAIQVTEELRERMMTMDGESIFRSQRRAFNSLVECPEQTFLKEESDFG